MKTTISAVPDFLTNYTDEVWKRTRECINHAGVTIPMLTFIRQGREFNLPIDYNHFVGIGKSMEKTVVAAQWVSAMGPEFGMLAMQMAQRGEITEHREQDSQHFLCNIEAMLYGMAPQAFFVSMPIKIVAGGVNPESIRELAAAGPDHPRAQNAMLVVGRNVIRSYAKIIPFLNDAQGQYYFDKGYTIDSFRGEPSQKLGPFSGIYEPIWN